MSAVRKGLGVVTTDSERIARNTATLSALREDMHEVKTELSRTRERLHKVEGFMQASLSVQQANRRSEERQYARLGFRVSLLALVVLIATFVEPFLVHLAGGN